MALAESFRHEHNTNGNAKAGVLAAALDKATETLLDEGKSPSRKVGENDNRGSHFFLTLNWAKELAAQTDDAELASRPSSRSLRPSRPRQARLSRRFSTSRAPPSTSAATTPRTRRSSTRPCARLLPSTKSLMA
ncbi:hypothetical protein HMPREF0308_1608 [Corynebacterium striatum ATCC 6940]|nr:hypothetical protein HMPREF0308_1608 [Corynebacterium striatum ATCC 6940]